MKQINSLVVAGIAVAFIGTLFSIPTVGAVTDKASIGGGSGIKFGTIAPDACTLTAIGTDNQANLVGITVGHCVDAAKTIYNDPQYAAVTAEYAPEMGVIGTVVYHKFSGASADYSNVANRDYSVINFDKTKVSALKKVGRTAINGIALTAPSWLSNVCKEGRTTAQTCGVVTGANFYSVKSLVFSAGGDSGAPLVKASDGTLVGYVQKPEGLPFVSATVSLAIQPVISDMNARAGIGAGFTLTQ